MRSRLPFPAVALAGCAFKTTAHTEPEQTVVLYACARMCGVTVLGGAGGYFEGYFGGAAPGVSACATGGCKLSTLAVLYRLPYAMFL